MQEENITPRLNLEAIGQRIKAERKRHKVTQEWLAEMINVTTHYIYEIERGMKAMSIETLINISSALEISTDYILFGKKDTDKWEDELASLPKDQYEEIGKIVKSILKLID